MKILNKIISIKIKNRIKLIDQVVQQPIKYQTEILKSNIKFSKNTLFGVQNNFKKITNYTDFKSLIPINNYENLKPYIKLAQKGEKNILWPKKVRWFAQSAGTTNNISKFIPITEESLQFCHFKSGKDMLAIYLKNYPNSKIFNGKSLMVGGSTNINTNQTYLSGDLSGIIIKNLPLWVQLKRATSLRTTLLKNWEKKIQNIIKETVQKNITNISGVPSWTIIIISTLLQKMEVKCLRNIWPNLELYMHGGVDFNNYKQIFNGFFRERTPNYLELYNASEGFFGIQNEPDKNDLLLLVNQGIFYEFIVMKNGQEIDTQIIPLQEVKLNVIYSMVISTNGGLWRYKIGDTIKFTSINPYKIKIVGRVQSFINAFGEEVNEDHVNETIVYVTQKTNSIIKEYIVAPFFFQDNSGCHEWIIEFEIPPKNINIFKTLLDEKLQSINSDYNAKRNQNLLIKEPIIHVVKRNFFYQLLKEKDKVGGQNKIQRLYNNRNFIELLIKRL